MGKSSSAQILARNHDYVYYEGDCFGAMKNPFLDLNVLDPSRAQIEQKSLKGRWFITKEQYNNRNFV